MYTLNLIHKLFPVHNVLTLLFGVYALPLFYGVFLRYTLHRQTDFSTKTASIINTHHNTLIDALYECVPKCGRSILMLGGYMVLFQVSFLTMEHFLNSINMITDMCYPLLEVTGGFFLLPQDTPLSWLLFYTTFGGACCIIQTYSFLKPAGLSIRSYLLHKTILAVIAFLVGVLL